MLIARKEYKDALRSRLFLVVLLLLVGLTATSILVSSLMFQAQLIEYRSAVQILAELGKVPSELPPHLFPLTLLRGFVDYLEIIGAILGVLLGYFSVAKEKNQGALELILTRPVERKDIVTGKFLGNAALLASVLLLIAGLVMSSVWSVAGVALLRSEVAKLLLVLALSLVYIMVFYLLASFLSLLMKSLSQSLMVCFAIWLMIVLILPQIGDTMDPDNQVPGGFFKSMNFNKDQERQVLAQFGSYETTRNFIEEISVTKHFERICFALFGIKPEFNDKSLSYILSIKWLDAVWVVAFLFVGIIANYRIINKRDALFGGIT
jgi:ABC-2 type transport system permease protein